MKNSLRKSFGLAQIPLMIVLLLMAIAVPVATKLVQDNADTRNMAAGGTVGNVCQLRGKTGGDCSSFKGNLGCACSGAGGKTCQTKLNADCSITCTANCGVLTGKVTNAPTSTKNPLTTPGVRLDCSNLGILKCKAASSCYWDYGLRGCFGTYNPTGTNPTGTNPTGTSGGSGTKCNTGDGWPGSCQTRSDCNEGAPNIQYDGSSCYGTLGCCGIQPSGKGTQCNTGDGWPGSCQTRSDCNEGAPNIQYDGSSCDGTLGCCGIQPGSGAGGTPTGTRPTSTNPTSKLSIIPTSSGGGWNPPLATATKKPGGGGNPPQPSRNPPTLTPTLIPVDGPTPTLIPVDGPTPTLALGGIPVLNYQISFAGVNPNSAQCVVDWPMKFTVLAEGEEMVYENVIAPMQAVVGDKLVFAGSLELVGFTHTTGVAVFITGPKHLQVKYGIDNQSSSYNKAGGELVLTTDPDTSISYNFSDYPLIVGDVIGAGSEEQDGVINGIDFVYVKTRSLIHETCEFGGYLQADLDGNCQVNSNDVNLLKISLQEKQGQLY